MVVGILQERVEPALRRCAFSDGSGKRRDKMRQKNPTATIEHLALLSVKHSIYLAELFNALVSAKEHGKAKIQTLTIECRGSIKQEAIFLITKEAIVIGHFRLSE
jgi:hypothetical protein